MYTMIAVATIHYILYTLRHLPHLGILHVYQRYSDGPDTVLKNALPVCDVYKNTQE